MKQMDDALYQAFLVRLWRDRSDAPWRVSLQGVDNAPPQHFHSLADFIAHLERLADTHPSTPDDVT